MTIPELRLLLSLAVAGESAATGEVAGSLMTANMIEGVPDQSDVVRLTARGRVHVEALQKLPLPVNIWVSPDAASFLA